MAFIYDAIRSPRTKPKETGGLADLTPLELMRQMYSHMEARTGLDKNAIADVILGCATQAGEQAGNIAKSSLLYANWPDNIPGITVNRYCASSLDAVNLAALKVDARQGKAILAGGIEMMSRVPMLADKAKVFMDPETAMHCRMLMMGNGADLIASLNNISREQVDKVAFDSQQRAATARLEGRFKSIVPIDNTVKGITVSEDECIRPDTTMASLARMPAVFAEPGARGVDAFQLQANPTIQAIEHLHTAGNSPAMADAASLTLIGDESLGLTPRARIIATVTTCDDPLQVLAGCIAATKKLLKEQGLKVADVDLFEIHEAFAATMVYGQRHLGIEDDKFNVNGGCIALGHPMGATGAIMLGTLLDELERRDLQRGIVATSGAAGTGIAMLIERI